MIMILLFKGGYYLGGGSIFGFFGFGLSILVAFVLLGLAITIIHELFCKLTGVDRNEKQPVWAFYNKLTEDTFADFEYQSRLCTCVLWAIALSVLGLWVMVMNWAMEYDSLLLSLLAGASLLLLGFLFLLFRHFYLRYLERIGRWAKWNLLLVMGVVVVIWIAVIQTMIAQSPSYKIRKFDRIIESCERSETVETDFFAGFRVGMTAKEFNAVADSLCQEGLVRWDSTGTGNRVRLAYLGYNSYKNNYCILSVSPTFYKGDEYLYHIGFGLVRGSDHAFRTKVVERLGQEGWRQLDLPGSCFDDGVKLPKYQVRMLSDPENLYNDQDKVYVKDNMMVVVRPYVVDFYDMPTFAQRPYWNNTY